MIQLLSINLSLLISMPYALKNYSYIYPQYISSTKNFIQYDTYKVKNLIALS